MEDVAMAAPGGLRWMGIYPFTDRQLTEYTIRKAEKLGFKALVVTVDSPVPGIVGAVAELIEQLNDPSYRYVNVCCYLVIGEHLQSVGMQV